MAATSTRAIEVQGLDDLRRELRRADRELPKQLAHANHRAGEIAADAMRRRAPRGPHQGGGNVIPVYQSIRSLRQQARAAVAVGSARSPHALVTNFGGTIGRRGGTGARTRVRGREFIFTGLAAARPEVMDTYEHLVIDQLTRRAFPQP